MSEHTCELCKKPILTEKDAWHPMCPDCGEVFVYCEPCYWNTDEYTLPPDHKCEEEEP